MKLTDIEIGAALEALSSGWLTMGPRVQALEAAVAEQLGVAHAIAVSSGSAALQLACVAAGVGRGAGAVVSALAGAAAHAPRLAGGAAVAADIQDPLRPEADLLAAVDAGTRAIIASHPAGVPVDAMALRAACDTRGLVLVEDATDALGATLPGGRPAGAAGHIGCLSLASGRVLGVGEGGLVVTDDAGLAARVRSLRSHAMTSVTWDRHRGHADSYDIVDIGFNFRLDEPRAALAHAQLGRLGALVAERRHAGDAVRAAAAGVSGVAPVWPDGLPAGAAPQAVPLVAADAARRTALAQALERRGVPVSAWPSVPAGMLPRAEDARARTVLLDLGCTAEAGLEPAAVAAALAAA